MKTIVLFGLVLGALCAAGKVFIAEVGLKVTLECGFDRRQNVLEWKRSPSTTIWKILGKNGYPSKGKDPIAPRSALSNTHLVIKNVKETDFGTFTCFVDGKSNEHTLIVVTVPGDQNRVLQVGASDILECKVNSPGNRATVQWVKPGGLVLNSNKVNLNTVATSDKGIWQCKVSQEEATFTKNITIQIKEPDPEPTTPGLKKNPKSPKSENGNSTSGGGVGIWDEDSFVLLGLVWWVWVAIGAGGLIVIILIVVIVVIYKRNRRKRREFLRMKLSQKPKKYCQCVRQTAAAKPQQGRRREKPSALPLQPLLQE